MCVSWTWVSHIVCVAWDMIETVVCVAWETIEVVFNVAASFVEMVLLVLGPIGGLLRTIWNLVKEVFWRVVNFLIDGVLRIFGIELTKEIRVCFAVVEDFGDPDRFNEHIKIALDAARIGIPYPQMDVHVGGKVVTRAA